jgi:hypothetical protein
MRCSDYSLGILVASSHIATSCAKFGDQNPKNIGSICAFTLRT